MGPSSSMSLDTKSDVVQLSAFMRLPTEVREMIYRPLLIARYTMREQNMTSEAYKDKRNEIQSRPDQRYFFYTAILATNRKIHEEAKDLCRRENDFVCLTSRQPSRLGSRLESLGLQIVARCSKTRSFWNISMSLILDPPEFSGWPDSWEYIHGCWQKTAEDRRAWNYIFCSDELPEFCRLLLRENEHTNSLHSIVLYIDISPAIGSGQATEIDTSPAGRTRLWKLLNPLRQLHSLGAVQIDGPVSGNYKGLVINSVCKDCPTALDIIQETVTSLVEADNQASKGQLREALLSYKAAISVVRSCSWRYDEREVVTDGGPFPGMKANRVTQSLVVRLQARIAAVYLNINRPRMVRIYIDRALHTYGLDRRRDEKIYHLQIEPWQQVVFAEVLHVAAMTSYMHGDVYEAKESLWKASEFVPFDGEQTSRYRTWRAHADWLEARRAKRDEVRTAQRQRYAKKIEVFIYNIYDKKKKGDRLMRNGRPLQAASVYKTALGKIKQPKWFYDSKFMIRESIFEDRSAVDAMNVLTCKLLAGLAAATLRSHKYKEVIQLTDSALKCSIGSSDCPHGIWDFCSHRYEIGCRGWEGHRKFDLVRLHYCRDLSLHRLGDTVSAIEHMEKALNLDPGDGTVFAQLTLLKQQQQEIQEEARKKRLYKLNGPQKKLYVKQARRKTMKL